MSLAQAARDLDIRHTVLRCWVKELGADPQHAFPGLGQMKPEQLEIDRLRKEVVRLKAERDIPKKAAVGSTRQCDIRFVFIAKHRSIWPVMWLCKALDVSRSGFHAWMNRKPAKRTLENEVIARVVRQSFIASDRTYGARRVWHDVLAEGFNCGLHRIERLMRANALKARPRRRYLPPDLGERRSSAVAPNVLDRQFLASAPNTKWIADFTYI